TKDVHAPPRRGEMVALGGLAALTLLLGVLWLPGGDAILERAADGEILSPTRAETIASFALVALGLVVVAVAWQRKRLVTLGIPAGVRSFIAGWWGIPTAARVLIVDPVSRLGQWLFIADRNVLARIADSVAAFAEYTSRILKRLVERGIDGVVWGIGGGTIQSAEMSRLVDDRGVDGTVEGVASGIGEAGKQSRKTQTGMSYHYYTAMMIGLVVAIAVATLWR
ncbi:MAG: hypothetical protein M3094_11470, partial [Actinomycetia bacterium]|nr:hypothetical protein [Actinomycetes bacterium]